MVPRRHADPLLEHLALPLPAASSSRTTTWSPRTPGAASSSPSTNWSTPASSTTSRYWVVTVDYAKAGAARPADADHRRERRARRRRRCTCCRRCGSATPGRGGTTDHPQAHAAARTATGSSAATRGPDRWCWSATATRNRCSARTRPTTTRLFGGQQRHAVPEGRHQRPRRARRGHGQPDAARAPRPRCTTRSRCPPGGSTTIRVRLVGVPHPALDADPTGAERRADRPRRRSSTR